MGAIKRDILDRIIYRQPIHMLYPNRLLHAIRIAYREPRHVHAPIHPVYRSSVPMFFCNVFGKRKSPYCTVTPSQLTSSP